MMRLTFRQDLQQLSCMDKPNKIYQLYDFSEDQTLRSGNLTNGAFSKGKKAAVFQFVEGKDRAKHTSSAWPFSLD